MLFETLLNKKSAKRSETDRLRFQPDASSAATPSMAIMRRLIDAEKTKMRSGADPNADRRITGAGNSDAFRARAEEEYRQHVRMSLSTQMLHHIEMDHIFRHNMALDVVRIRVRHEVGVEWPAPAHPANHAMPRFLRRCGMLAQTPAMYATWCNSMAALALPLWEGQARVLSRPLYDLLMTTMTSCAVLTNYILEELRDILQELDRVRARMGTVMMAITSRWKGEVNHAEMDWEPRTEAECAAAAEAETEPEPEGVAAFGEYSALLPGDPPITLAHVARRPTLAQWRESHPCFRAIRASLRGMRKHICHTHIRVVLDQLADVRHGIHMVGAVPAYSAMMRDMICRFLVPELICVSANITGLYMRIKFVYDQPGGIEDDSTIIDVEGEGEGESRMFPAPYYSAHAREAYSAPVALFGSSLPHPFRGSSP
jgi:hypothetical protein